ncbi:MAG: SpoIID/LytB domain-containing protein [Selenomonadaceae bacterium]|nr:SpoIID/LytB domain-containing protein [Selenomonadaceae bacterium]
MRRVKFLLQIFLALMLLAVPTQAAESTWQPEIRIGILSSAQSVELEISASGVIVDGADAKKILGKIAAGEKISFDAGKIEAEAIEIRGEKVALKDLQVTINGKKYFGGVRLAKTGNALTVVNLVPIEEYLRGVVPNEMSIAFHAEALKAQAVAARTFALKNRGRHKAEGYDLCATNHCQLYNGVEEVAATDKAISETRGEVIVLSNEKLVDANFHTDSGGMTENIFDVWKTKASHLVPVAELETKTQPWTKEFPAQSFAERIGGGLGELKFISLSKLEIGKAASDRTSSGRAKTVTIVGSEKTVQVSGIDLRTKFSLPSTLFDVEFKEDKVIFTGYGRGHGVGMSQYGAQAYAKSGWDYKKILAHYYTGTGLKKLY